MEASRCRLFNKGSTRCRLLMCFLCSITAAATVLFFKGEYFLEMQTNLLRLSPTFDRNGSLDTNESQPNQTYKVICMILTRASNWETRGKAVQNTWAKRCHKAVFFYTRIQNCPSHPICKASNTVGLNVADGRGHLTAKTLGALDYSYAKYGLEADYFFKADDDTYVIMENLQRILSQFQSVSLLYLGKLFTNVLPKGYNSGGAGYVISKLAVKLLVESRTLYPSECLTDGGYEDMEIGRCLARFGIYPQDEMDSTRKQVFHSENPLTVLQQVNSGPASPGAYSYININGVEFGNKREPRSHMLSDWTATMHYVTPSEMYMYEFLLYHLKRHKNINERTDA